MLDLGKIAEAVGALAGGSAQEQIQNALLQRLSEAGLDPAMLEGLDAQQAIDMLASHGIGLGAFDQSQITQLLSGLGGGEVASGITDWLSARLRS